VNDDEGRPKAAPHAAAPSIAPGPAGADGRPPAFALGKYDLQAETAELLARVRALIGRFVRCPDAALDVAAVWILHTHAIGAADSTAYLHITGPTKRCGKTRLLETLRLLAARPLATANATPAAIFRALSADPPPTLFVDEADALFRPSKGGESGAEDLRALLNAGNRRGTPALRCVGSGADMRPKEFPVFGPKALAGIGDLPDTLADRSLRIRLDRLGPGERVERLLESKPPAEVDGLRESLAAWADLAVEQLKALDPEIPAELDDRAADACLALLAIADLAGGNWPERIRSACVALRRGDETAEPSRADALLACIRRAMDSLPEGERAISTAALLDHLAGDEDAPYGFGAEDKGRERRLARLLRPFGVRPKAVRLGDGTVARGYAVADLEAVLHRYAVPLSVTSATTASLSQNPPASIRYRAEVVTDNEEGANPHGKPGVTHVTDRRGGEGQIGLGTASLDELEHYFADPGAEG
jgi:hypothetical protein